jgi:hypothetical protein
LPLPLPAGQRGVDVEREVNVSGNADLLSVADAARTRRPGAPLSTSRVGAGALRARPTLLRHSPLFGDHTREVLTTVAGLSDAEFDDLYAAGIAADKPVNPGAGLRPSTRPPRKGMYPDPWPFVLPGR